jgi:formate/nitrite transporter
MVFQSPIKIFAKAGETGKSKAGLTTLTLVLRGFLAGAFIAIGGALATVCSTGIVASASVVRDAPQLAFGVSSAGFGQLIMGAVFPVGIFITVLTGAELFAGDAMLTPIAAFTGKITWQQILNLWIWVYLGNLIGSVVFAYFCAYGPFVSFGINVSTGATTATVTSFGTQAIAIAVAKTNYVGLMGLYSAFLKGIAGIWLVNLAILLGMCADDAVGKFFGIWFPIMALVSSGFEYSVTNMYFIPAGILTAGVTNTTTTANWINLWTANLIPVTLGNIVGGFFFAGVIYWFAFRKEIAALR